MTAANSSTGPKRTGVDCCVLARTSKRRNNASVFSVPLFEFTLRSKSVLALIAVALLPSGMYGQTATATVKAGADPRAVAVNPVTNKIYIANHDSVTVIDGASDRTTTVAAGLAPSSVAVNAAANKIYVANHDDGTVTIIDGGTNSTKLVTAGVGPVSVAVNPVTNKIYVANSGSRNLTVIDGLTDSTNSVVAGDGPASVAVNPVTNKIYVANHDSGTVTVVDGLTNSTATITAGSKPISIAVNPATNMVYVANHDSGTLTIIDGASNRTTTVATGLGSLSVAVNPVTNKIYVANHDSGTVTIIYAPSDITKTVTTGGLPSWVVVNSMKNQIYVANEDSDTASVIDGANDSAISVNTGAQPLSAAVNPVTNKVYVANSGSNNVTVIDGAFYSTSTITTGQNPITVALNPVTNKIYVANFNYLGNNESSVTVIDGATGETTNVPTGKGSNALAVNPVTNKVYVTNAYSNSVTVIDGATNSTTTVPVGILPVAIEVNPVTKKIYVADGGNPPVSNGDVAVIDGDNNRTTFVRAELYPRSIAVNPVTNKIYVVNNGSDSVTEIDGATNITTTVATEAYPISIAVNSATNRIYVVNQSSDTVTVIDGASNRTASVPVGQYPNQVAVNSISNKIYVANIDDDTVTVIDGSTNGTTSIAGGRGPWSLTVNPVTNKIYVADGGGTAAVIDGITNTVTTVPSGSGPFFVAVNQVTNKAYVVNTQGSNVTVIEESSAQPIPLVTSISPLAGDRTDSPNPSFTFSAKSGTVSTPDHVFFQLDTWQNPWGVASGSNRAFQGSLTSVQPGFHILYAYASNGQEATSTQQGSPLISPIQSYGFLAYGLPALTGLHLRANRVTTVYGQPIVLTATVQSAKGQPLGTVVFSNGSNVLGSAALDFSGSATLMTKVLPVGSDAVTATYLGDASYSSSTATLIQTVGGPDVPTLISLAPKGGEGQSQAFTAVYSDGNGLSDLGTVSILINTSGSTAHACYAFYSLATNYFYLTDDAGNESLPPFAPGQPASAANSQCTLSGAGSSVTTSGSTITVIFALSFTSNFNASKNVYIGAVRRNGFGTGAVQEGSWLVLAPGLTLSHTALSFAANPNVPHSERVYVTNYTSQSISLNPTIKGSNAFRIIAQFGSCAVIGQYETCGINIAYTPTSLGNGTATLYLNPTGGSSSENPKVALSGLSVDPTVLVSRPTLTFLTPPGTSDYQRVYITNNLPYTLNLLPVLPSSQFSFVNDCSAIGSFQTCGININFSPRAVEQISGSMKLNFQNAPAGTEPQVLLEANSGGSPPVLVSTTRLRLVTVIGTIVTSTPVFITNNTQKTISVDPVVTGNSEFTLSSTCSTLTPKQMCSIAVHFAGSADQIATGSVALNLGNAPAHSPSTIQLEGFAPIPSSVTVNGQSQDFFLGITTSAGSFQTSVITVLNGTAHLLQLAPFISGTVGNASFHIKQPCTSIPSEEVCQMTVLGTPPTVGFSSATLDVHPTNLQAGDGNPPVVLLQVSGTPAH